MFWYKLHKTWFCKDKFERFTNSLLLLISLCYCNIGYWWFWHVNFLCMYYPNKLIKIFYLKNLSLNILLYPGHLSNEHWPVTAQHVQKTNKPFPTVKYALAKKMFYTKNNLILWELRKFDQNLKIKFFFEVLTKSSLHRKDVTKIETLISWFWLLLLYENWTFLLENH